MAKKRRGPDLLLTMEVTREGLRPWTPFDHEKLQEYPLGSLVEVSVYKPRGTSSAKLWRKYWATMSTVARGMGTNSRQLHRQMLVAMGKVDAIQTFADEIMYVPISVSELSDAEFAEFYQEAEQYIITRLVPGMTIEEILDRGNMPL